MFFLIDNIKGLYNNCLFHLLDLDLRGKSIEEQYKALKPLNALPFKYCILNENITTILKKIFRYKKIR